MNYKINDKVYVDMNEFFPYIREITGNDYISTGIIRNERKNEFYHEYLIEWKNQAKSWEFVSKVKGLSDKELTDLIELHSLESEQREREEQYRSLLTQIVCNGIENIK